MGRSGNLDSFCTIELLPTRDASGCEGLGASEGEGRLLASDDEGAGVSVVREADRKPHTGGREGGRA
eukprot:3282382-Rhodomonas_salina.2